MTMLMMLSPWVSLQAPIVSDVNTRGTVATAISAQERATPGGVAFVAGRSGTGSVAAKSGRNV